MSSTRHNGQARGDAKRRIILAAAANLMVQEGLKQLTHRKVAEAAGVSVGSVGYYFQSREQLIEVCFREAHQRRFDMLQDMLDKASPDCTPQEVAAAVLSLATGGTSDNVEGFVYAIADGIREQGPEAQKRARVMMQETIDMIASLLDAYGYGHVSGDGAVSAIMGATIIGCQRADDAAEEARQALVALIEGGRVNNA